MKVGKNKRGFTIVELLIVVVVIGILAAITIVAYNGIQNRAKASAAQSAASQAVKKIMTYAVTNGDQYPDTLEAAGVNAADAKLEYTVDNSTNPKTYCITGTAGNISYYASNTQTSAVAGACFGHALNGNPMITNLVSNPSFETNTSGWTISGNITTTYETTGGIRGARFYSGARTSTAAIGFYSPQFPVTVGETYTASASIRVPTGRAATLRYTWFDGAGASLSNNTSSANAGTGAWQTATYSAAAPASAATGRIDVVLNTTGAVAGDVLAIDGFIVTKGSTTYAYGDGTSAGWSWSGTAHASTSSGPPL